AVVLVVRVRRCRRAADFLDKLLGRGRVCGGGIADCSSLVEVGRKLVERGLSRVPSPDQLRICRCRSFKVGLNLIASFLVVRGEPCVASPDLTKPTRIGDE